MDREEQIASEFLKSTTGTIPVFEPNGQSTFPDFAIGQIAVEVTKFVTNLEYNGKIEAASKKGLPLRKSLENGIKGIEYDPKHGTYLIDIFFSRPYGRTRSTTKRVIRKLRQFYDSNESRYDEVELSRNVSGVIQKIASAERAFTIGIFWDKDADLELAQNYITAVNAAIARKERIVEKCEKKYPEYWLILFDEVHFASNNILARIEEHVHSNVFRRVIYMNKYSRRKHEFRL